MKSYWKNQNFYYTENQLVLEPKGRDHLLRIEQLNVDAIRRHEQYIASQAASLKSMWREEANLSRHDREQIMRRMKCLNKASL